MRVSKANRLTTACRLCVVPSVHLPYAYAHIGVHCHHTCRWADELEFTAACVSSSSDGCLVPGVLLAGAWCLVGWCRRPPRRTRATLTQATSSPTTRSSTWASSSAARPVSTSGACPGCVLVVAVPVCAGRGRACLACVGGVGCVPPAWLAVRRPCGPCVDVRAGSM